MRQQLLDELMQVSEEESKYRAGQVAIEEKLYSEVSVQEIDRQKLLRRGKLITVRPHSRFVEFPMHRFRGTATIMWRSCMWCREVSHM